MKEGMKQFRDKSLDKKGCKVSYTCPYTQIYTYECKTNMRILKGLEYKVFLQIDTV